MNPRIEDAAESGSWIEIDSACLQTNLLNLKKHIAPAELCMVVKGNAYGHGYDPIVPIAEGVGVRRFAVFSAREAARFLRATDGQSRLMVMGRATPAGIPWMVENDLEPWVNDLQDLDVIIASAEAADTTVRIHVEVETGMNRTGLEPEDAITAARRIHQHPRLVLEGICTHFAGRESSENDDRIAKQWTCYSEVVAALEQEGIRPNVRHVSSSAAAILDPDCQLDLVRVGIASYGLWPSRQVHEKMARRKTELMLHNVLQWKAQVVSVKEIDDGEFVGYGTSYEAEGNTRIAVVGVGYSDGFARDLSNRGHVLIRGRRAQIVGSVGMNLIQVNVRHIPDVCVGDEVVLIGRQGSREISVSSFADFSSIVNYELMSRLNHDIPRIVVASDPVAPPLQ